MIVSPISDPVEGELLTGVVPKPRPMVDDAGWLRRLNYFTGRSLSDVALTLEQDWRAGHLATAGQTVSHGVVSGLEVGLEEVEGRLVLHIGTGLGITASGEDVVIPRALRLEVDDLWIYRPATTGSTTTTATGENGSPRPIDPEGGPVGKTPPDLQSPAVVSRLRGTVLSEVPAPREIAAVPRLEERLVLPQASVSESVPVRAPPVPTMRLDGPVGELRARKEALPRVAVLVLEPTTSEVYGARDPSDPCEQDPAAEAFADWQLVDGCRAVLYSWPWPERLPADGPKFRNELAYDIFRLEQSHAPGEYHPWELVGVPIALVGFRRPRIAIPRPEVPPYVDSYAVVRDGGKPRRRSRLIDGVGDVFLWQARLQQFAEQLAEVDWQTTGVEEVFSRIRYFPPAGLLPKKAVELTLDHLVTTIFPDYFGVEAAPVPLEQLEAVLEASAPLEPFDTARRDVARILVPVPQALYDPRLLFTEHAGPEFQQAIDRFSAARWSWLRRREEVRRRAEALLFSISGAPSFFPDPRRDPARLETEIAPGTPPWPGMHAHLSKVLAGTHQHFFQSADPPLPVAEGDVLFADVFIDPDNLPTELMLQWNDGSWEHRAYWGENRILWGSNATDSRRSMGSRPETGKWLRLQVPAAQVGLVGKKVLGMSFALFGGRAAWGAAGRITRDPATGTEREVLWMLDTLPQGAVAVDAEDGWSWLAFDQDLGLPADEKEENYGTVTRSWKPREVQAITRLRDRLGQSPLKPEEIDQLEARGLSGFMEYLQARIKTADDRVDFGFLRVQTDMYRLRSVMMGETKATRLATSPALAEIIKSESALGVSKQLLTYLDSVKLAQAAAPIITPPAGTTSSAPLNASINAEQGVAFDRGTRFAVATKATGTPQLGSFGFGQTAQLVTVVAPARTLVAASVQAAPTATQAARTLTEIAPVQAVTRSALRSEVLLRSPIVGEAFDFRSVTVGERLASPIANEARSFTVATKYEIVKGLAALELNVADLPVSGLITVETVNGVEQVKLSQATRIPVRSTKKFGELTGLLEKLILGEPNPENGDEAAFFSVGVEILDSTIATLRHVEGRIQEYRYMLEKCEDARQEILGLADQADRRLKSVEDELSESRHDVAVARALLADEERRAADLTARRQLILREEVRFLAYHRPRLTHGYLDAPVRRVDPALVQSPVPACLNEGVHTPPELSGMVELLREAPIRWYQRSLELINALDSRDVLLGTIRNARARADRGATLTTFGQVQGSGRGRLVEALGRTFASQQRVVMNHRSALARLDLSTLGATGFQEIRALAEKYFSLGDLIDAAHGFGDLDRRAVGLVADIQRIATCLYARFSEVPPRIRLEWAERLGEHDEAVNLRNLHSLPRWGELEYLDRREMQSLADWLYEQVKPLETEGVAMMSDLIRICLLLASHAPVNQILAGYVPRQTSARVGEVVELAVDMSLVRVGMPVTVFDHLNRPVQAVVEDLAGGVAVSRILNAPSTTVTILEGARAQLGGPLTATTPAPFSGARR